ncbi:MAG TPA: hypothetical protein PLA90_13810 [Candidatus Sumerlaeota bacterium]|nr:hypothetical protein [Candidatus Sumerlaeota bacterium]
MYYYQPLARDPLGKKEFYSMHKYFKILLYSVGLLLIVVLITTMQSRRSRDRKLVWNLEKDKMVSIIGFFGKKEGKPPENIDFLLYDKHWATESQIKIRKQLHPEMNGQSDFFGEALSYRSILAYAVAEPPDSGIVAILDYGENGVSSLQTNDLKKLLSQNISLIKRMPELSIPVDSRFNSMSSADKKELYLVMKSLSENLDDDDGIAIYDLARLTDSHDDGTTEVYITAVIRNHPWSKVKNDPFFKECSSGVE